MNQDEFLARWQAERAGYEAWGMFVRETVEQGLTRRTPPVDVSTFVKIPATPRLKTEDSLLGKAFHRPDKNYTDPYVQITDKVGLRFVVLLSSDIAVVKDVIEHCPYWDWSLDRDYEEERQKRPTEFAYQSIHYVVTPSAIAHSEGLQFPTGVACEIQVRTLLQHAHSELTHDNVYKVSQDVTVSNSVRRTVARSMALIEAVDESFERALEQLREATKPERDAMLNLSTLYRQYVNFAPGSDLTNQIVLQAFRDQLGGHLVHGIEEMIRSRPFIPERIRERHSRLHSFRQPWILLAYYLVGSRPELVRHRWPLTDEEVQPVFTDLGVRLH